MAKHYPRSDFIADVAIANAYHERRHERPRIPPLPDLRFEPTFTRKVGRYVRIEYTTGGQELVRVEWSRALWVTVKDQVLSPFIQGMIWGSAVVLLRHFWGSAWRSLRSAWSPSLHYKKGEFVTWLRAKSHRLFTGIGQIKSL